MKVAVLQNEDPLSSQKWQQACEKSGIPCEIINLTASDWLSQVLNEKYDFFLMKPPGNLSHFKTLYDERHYIISKVLKLKTFPSYEECFIYENKKLLSYFLEAQGIPHPKTSVFYDLHEAHEFLSKTTFPLVAKTSIGASGSGVTIIRSKDNALKYVSKAFSKKGIKRQFGPNRNTGTPGKWLGKALKEPRYFVKRLKVYFSIHKHGERDFVIFQEYIPHAFEWRAVRIGDSYFAHQKVKVGDKASGSKGIDYVNPPESLLNFIKDLCETNRFNFMAIDIFEDGKGGYLVNELQTLFGHVQDYILSIDGRIGRFRFLNNQWVFEEGNFNTNESYDLRLETALSLYKNGNW
ncbi:MAG TPA: hypothetical protein PLW31_03630 [Bacteroidales bacterium]|nr:hypothetical protein [Bacteroidales bacterium]HPI85096.1 hypothetical protein [Bacteroidales bacterium]HPM91711.1 hypothetical protein [Bacteroidales bacterium]